MKKVSISSTTAVYVAEEKTSDLPLSYNITKPITVSNGTSATCTYKYYSTTMTATIGFDSFVSDNPKFVFWAGNLQSNNKYFSAIVADKVATGHQYTYEHNGKTVYFSTTAISFSNQFAVGTDKQWNAPFINDNYANNSSLTEDGTKEIAWTMVYGDSPEPPEPCEDVEMPPRSPCKPRDIYVPPCNIKCPPVRIEITVPPNKLKYTSGEPIDLTGIVVRAFKANGNLWGGYEHGIIPISQLDYTPKVANLLKRVADGSILVSLVSNWYGDSNLHIRDVYKESNEPSYCYWKRYSENAGEVINIGRTANAAKLHAHDYNDRGYNWNTTSTAVKMGDWYMSSLGLGPDLVEELAINIPRSQMTPEEAIEMLERGNTDTVTVSWDYDDTVMTDTFEIRGE